MINEKLKATGALRVVIRDEAGAIKEEFKTENLVVTTGLNFIADRMVNNSTAMSHMAIGSDGTAALAGNTTLGTELGRVALTSSTPSTNTVEYEATFGASVGTGGVEEAAIFNAGTGGDMLCRTTFSVVNKGAADSMTITWTITIS